MSLLDEYAHECVILKQERTQDEEGGWTTKWVDDEKFINHQALNSTMEAKRAEQEGVTSLYEALVDKGVDISYDDYFRDEVTGKTYRVTSNPDEEETPASATFSLKHFSAERKEPPT